MTKNYYFLTLLFVTIGWSTRISANVNDDDILVITGARAQDLSLQQIRQIYLGMNISAGSSRHINIATLPNRNPARHLFNVKVIGLSEARIRAFWAQMKFSGRGNRPIELAEPNQVIEYIKKNQQSIGYVPTNITLPSEVKIIYSSGLQD